SGSEHNSSTSCLNLPLSSLRHELRLHDNRLIVRQHPFAQDLEVPKLSDVDHRSNASSFLGGLVLHLLRHHRPELVDVDDGAEEPVLQLVEVPHPDFPEVAWMVLVEEDPVVVHASGVTSASGMLAVLSDTSVSGADVTPLLAVLLQSGRHCCFSLFSGRRWCGEVAVEERFGKQSRVSCIYISRLGLLKMSWFQPNCTESPERKLHSFYRPNHF
ncbi:hypothetical protein LINGRAHAP2_LOCUS37028, partial [Linum grandiflorum]